MGQQHTIDSTVAPDTMEAASELKRRHGEVTDDDDDEVEVGSEHPSGGGSSTGHTPKARRNRAVFNSDQSKHLLKLACSLRVFVAPHGEVQTRWMSLAEGMNKAFPGMNSLYTHTNCKSKLEELVVMSLQQLNEQNLSFPPNMPAGDRDKWVAVLGSDLVDVLIDYAQSKQKKITKRKPLDGVLTLEPLPANGGPRRRAAGGEDVRLPGLPALDAALRVATTATLPPPTAALGNPAGDTAVDEDQTEEEEEDADELPPLSKLRRQGHSDADIMQTMFSWLEAERKERRAERMQMREMHVAEMKLRAEELSVRRLEAEAKLAELKLQAAQQAADKHPNV